MKKIRRTLGLSIVLALVACGALAGQAFASTQPAIVGSVNSNATGASSLTGVTSVATSGNFAYAASYWSGELNVIDISNPASPTWVASTPSNAAMIGATNVTISGTLAFVTSKNQNNTCMPGPPPACTAGSNDNGNGNSLTIVDISNPMAPTVVGTPLHDSTNLFGAYSVAVSGNFAYVASQGLVPGQPTTPDTSMGRFAVIALTGAGSPDVVGHIDNSLLAGTPQAGGLNHATSVAVSGNTAYVTAWAGDALTAIDISTPSNPTVLWSYKDTTNLTNPNDVAVSGNYAYVVNQASSGIQLTVFQLNSNPASLPTRVASISDNAVLGGAYRIRIQGDFAYVSGNGISSVGAIDISNPAAPRVAGSVNDPLLLFGVDGISTTGGGRYLVTTSPALSSETVPAYPPYPFFGGPTNTGTVSVIDLEPATMQVSIAGASEPANPTSQTAANFSFDTGDAVAAVQCSLDGATPGPCSSSTSASYSSLSPGAHTFQVTATYSTGATSQATYAWTINKSSTPPPPPPGSSAPKVTKAPNISGTAQQGKTLTASTGTWSGSPAPTFRYKWERCTSRGCTAISNQTGRTYRVTLADVGDRLEVVVTASNVAGSASSSFTDPSAVKWSAASFATANLTGAKTAHPGFNLSVPSPGSNLKLKQLVIALPTGISPAALHRLAAGTSVRDLKGKRLAFTARLSHGKLTLSFKKPPTGVKVKIASGFVTISASLHRKLKRSKPSEKLSLTLNYSGKPARRGTVKLHLS